MNEDYSECLTKEVLEIDKCAIVANLSSTGVLRQSRLFPVVQTHCSESSDSANNGSTNAGKCSSQLDFELYAIRNP
jgi:hypothetical protein